MRMWMVPPELMCRQHILGEHRELHALVGSIRLGISLAGFLANGLLQAADIGPRHDALVVEFRRRDWKSGLQHQTPLVITPELRVKLEAIGGVVDSARSRVEMHRRCTACRALQEARLGRAPKNRGVLVAYKSR